MSFSQLVILAVIQGAAELLPVSSSAHVIVAQRLMNLDPGAPEMTLLLVMLHTGTMGAVIVYFRSRWRKLLVSGSRPFLKAVVIATTCTGVVGLGLKVFIEKILLERFLGFAHGEVEHLFRNLPLIGVALGAVGILIVTAGRRQLAESFTWVNHRNAALIGVVQGLCLPFRGFSRSGATISTALWGGVARDLAEDFSFALAVVLTPPVLGLELHRFWRAQAEHAAAGTPAAGVQAGWIALGVVGMLLSFCAGLFALVSLSKALDGGRWQWFGYYCLVASGLVLLGSTLGVL